MHNKFRRYDEEAKEFLYFDLDNVGQDLVSFARWGALKTPIQQWTGLKDKNGKEIYEGDILKTVLAKYPFRVTYKLQGLSYEVINEIKDDHAFLFPEYCSTYEVIGNINETYPEIMEEDI